MANLVVTPQVANNGTNFEQQHVQHVYEEIAASMNDIQHKAWPNVKRFLKKFPPGALVADIGCGNGRYLNINKSTYKVGVDVCSGLVDNARTKGYEVAYADNLNLPFRDGAFDGVVSIGVIHHFCSVERRIKALRELARILQPGGKLMLYVWAFEQKRRKFDSQDVLIPWRGNSKTRPSRNGSSSSFGMSSTSSVSEDETAVQSSDTREQSNGENSHQKLRRQSSLSADDVTALLELNEFKPNYYSLDFSGSPKHLKKEDKDMEANFFWNKKSLRKCHSSTKSDKLIRECRKLEASLRAMSSGSLDALEAKCRDERFGLESNSFDGYNKIDEENSVNGTIDNLCSSETEVMNGIVDEKALGVTLDWNVGDLETDDFEAEIPNPCAIYETDFKCVGERIESARLENGREKRNCDSASGRKHLCSKEDSKLPKHFNRTYHPKINPFMKQDSLDPYTFNNVICRASQVKDNMVADFDVMNEIQDVIEEVHVEFKLPTQTKGAKKSERSFFNAVKSKLLEIFDDKSDSKDRIEKNGRKQNVNLVTNHVKSPTSPLSKEQLDLASRLNFKVREFPLSSCPDVVHEEKISPRGNILSDSGIDLDNDNLTSTSGARNHMKENWANETQLLGTRHTVSLEGKLFTDTCNEISYNRCHSESALLNGIYDGYIKIDVGKLCENGDIGLTDFHGSALRYSESNHEHIVGINGQDFEADSRSLPEDIVNGLQERLSEKCKVGEKRFDKSVNASQDRLSEENCKDLVENGLLEKDSNLSGRTCRSGKSNSKAHCVGQRSRNESEAKEDDAVFELEGDEEMSNKLCRYYHVFRKGEIEALISKFIPDLHIVQCFYDHANWCIITEKI